ncbi:hypothetical protein WEU38_17080 [Cyanobacterium aponinum AL20118]|uniref:PepSY domain-containing protein n=1 Tax=Cyanobacterium aponinum AL20115 TaxID=3090662 RepID=A0AAF0ZDU3_9CHRO|nr:hypothetical protein [Cyanobacterium aponinum]WPF88498.1 hypothetical protein SAY89_17160 [Cyanobacterium aponinum AL20115]
MKINSILLFLVTVCSTFSFSTIAKADSIQSRCDIYPKGEDKASKVVNCIFSQRQGFITITREDGVTYDLEPSDNQYIDQNGKTVTKEIDGNTLIFRFQKESVYLYQGEKAPSSSNSSHSLAQTPENLISTTPTALKDLVGAKAGQAENTLISRGYTYRNTVTFEGGKSAYYVETKTGYCVEVGTVDGRYSSIVYNTSDRCNK